MTEAEWWGATDPDPLFRCLYRNRVSADRKLRLFGVACGQRVIGYGRESYRELLRLNEAFASEQISEDQFRGGWHSFVAANPEPPDELSKRVWTAIVGETTNWPTAIVSCRTFARWGCDTAVWALMPESLDWDTDPGTLALHPEGFRYFEERAAQARLLHDIFGPLPFREVAVTPEWLTADVIALARGVYDSKAFDRMPVLADALQDAGCDHAELLAHCRAAGWEHVRGCWVLDLLLGRPWREPAA
jgi:hypothetical protein